MERRQSRGGAEDRHDHHVLGFFAPDWVLQQIPSCDGLFASTPPSAPTGCGKVTTINFHEPHDDFTVLPMPWNPIYKSAFQTFLVAFAERYGANPLFVCMDIGGPTAATTEIIQMNGNQANQTQFGGPPISPNDMWISLLAFAFPGQAAYQASDQIFIDEWIAATDMFGSIFKGLTLMIWTGDGLPDFNNKPYPIPSAFKDSCPLPDMDCQAQATILTHFIDPSVAPMDAKATGEAGMNGHYSTIPFDFGVNSAKLLSQNTASLSPPAAQILAGEQFGTSFYFAGLNFGCSSVFPPDATDPQTGCSIPSTCTTDACIPVACIPQACLAGVTTTDLASMGYTTFGEVVQTGRQYLIPPEQEAFNVLRNFFDRTPAAAYYGGTPGTEPANFLQIYNSDFQYAASTNAPATIVRPDSSTFSTTATELLTLANQQLLAMAEDGPVITAAGGLLGPSGTIAPNALANIQGQNLSPVGFDEFAPALDIIENTLPIQLRGVSVTVNGSPASLVFISSTLVTILTPADMPSGPVSVQVTTGGRTSASFTVEAKPL